MEYFNLKMSMKIVMLTKELVKVMMTFKNMCERVPVLRSFLPLPDDSIFD